MKEYRIKEVSVDGVFANSETKGCIINWEDYDGYFGQIRITSPSYVHLVKDNIRIDSENMSPEFVKAVLCRMVDLAFKRKI